MLEILTGHRDQKEAEPVNVCMERAEHADDQARMLGGCASNPRSALLHETVKTSLPPSVEGSWGI